MKTTTLATVIATRNMKSRPRDWISQITELSKWRNTIDEHLLDLQLQIHQLERRLSREDEKIETTRQIYATIRTLQSAFHSLENNINATIRTVNLLEKEISQLRRDFSEMTNRLTQPRQGAYKEPLDKEQESDRKTPPVQLDQWQQLELDLIDYLEQAG